jgi:hypothetical protein
MEDFVFPIMAGLLRVMSTNLVERIIAVAEVR